MAEIMRLKKLLLLPLLFIAVFATAQKVESIYTNLYTDSLKKGTFNYINIDGLLSNGRYMPLDSTQIIFWSSDGKFHGNELWVDKDFKNESIFIKAILRSNPKISKEFTMFIKKKIDDEKLPTSEEMLKPNKSKKKNKN